MINKMILQGRLTADPELRQTQSGISVCSFTVAWSEKRNEIETKCFLRCTAWRGTAEFLSQYFSKGKEIVVEGKLNTREWEDADGNKRSSIELAVDTIHFCGSKSVDVNISASGLKDEEFETIETGDTLPF